MGRSKREPAISTSEPVIPTHLRRDRAVFGQIQLPGAPGVFRDQARPVRRHAAICLAVPAGTRCPDTLREPLLDFLVVAFFHIQPDVDIGHVWPRDVLDSLPHVPGLPLDHVND